MTGTADHRVTPADLVELEVLSDVALAPDGRLAIFASGKAYDGKEKKSPQKLIAATLPDGVCQPFSAGTAVDRMPRWSPDGSVLAFLSDRPHGLPETSHPADTQVYLLPRAGGEAHRLTSVGGEIHDLVWDPHGTCLFVLMVEPEPEDERRRREGRGDAHDVEAQPRFWRVWRVDLASGEIQPCTPPAMQVWDFALSADAGELVLVASAYPYEWSWYEARLVTLTVADPATVRTLYAGPCQLAHPRLSPDGHLIAVTAGIWSDRGAYGGDVLVVDRTDDTVRNCTADRRVAVEWAEWEPDGHSLLCAGYEEGESAFWRLATAGDLQTLWRAPVAIRFGQSQLARSGSTIAVLRGNLDHPTELWTAEFSGQELTAWRQITNLHPHIQDWELGEIRPWHWLATDGTSLQGLLALPPNYQDGSRIPLVTLVHGGPASLYTYDFLAGRWTRALTATGMAVFLPNPRGSVGWGATFMTANLGDMGGADLEDILAGVDAVVDRGIADPSHLGIGGWSYGGFMTAWAITRTTRFQAAVMGAGIADWRSFHGVSNIPTWDAIFYGQPGQPADPYDQAGPYARYSAVASIESVITPTLILHGENDECVPVGQGYQFYRALRDRGVPVEMSVYPRAGHGPKERAQVLDIYDRIVRWFAHHLQPEVTP